MKIVIISDIHANMEALEALPTLGDRLWVLGDLVNYGPDPAAVVEWVRKRAAVVVRGNHDHAVATGEDPRCSAPFREMSSAMLAYTRASLRDDQRGPRSDGAENRKAGRSTKGERRSGRGAANGWSQDAVRAWARRFTTSISTGEVAMVPVSIIASTTGSSWPILSGVSMTVITTGRLW